MKAPILLLSGVLLLAACAPKRVHEEPVLRNGDRVQPADEVVEATRAQTARDNAELVKARDDAAAHALATCAPSVGAAIARGEHALGMTEPQALAATRT